ncbi:MAG: PAS domain S-box protein [Candidatus Electrothrix sp. GM3_4]|nr:PAS domain S-box protein [Candidatus Electrothrix sp. GM3_4]
MTRSRSDTNSRNISLFPQNLLPGFLLMSGFSFLLVLINQYSYLLFHFLTEFFSIVVAIIMLVVTWYTYSFSRNHFLMYLGCGYIWVALLDLFHTLIYKGMAIFPISVSGNPAIQFCLAGRSLEALLLLTAPIFLTRSLRRRAVMGLFALVTFLLIAAVFSGFFPDAYQDGIGRTPFKMYSEYLIVTVMAGAGLFLFCRRTLLSPRIYRIMLAGIVLAIGADLAFIFYMSVHGLPNLIGHLFRLYSFWLIYEAIIHTTLHEPFTVLTRDANVYHAIPQATVLLDQDGKLRQANKAACLEVGLEEIELVGKDCHALFHPVDLSRESCPLCRALQVGAELPPTELKLDNERGWRKFTLSSVDTGGGGTGVVQVSTDIDKRKMVEAELEATLDNLDRKVVQRTRELHSKIMELEQAQDHLVANEKMASLGRLVAGFAHEINTPIGIAVGAASQLQDAANEIKRMLESEEVEEDELEEVLEIITEGTGLTLNNLRRAADLVQRFKRSSIDRTSEILRHFRVRELIEDVLISLHNILKKTKIKVTVECPEELRIISVPGLIEQVLVNLIQNSLIHGFDNSSSRGEIHISCSSRDTFHMEYRDNGKGISPEALEHLFEPFYTTKRGSGSGLGMYISYNLVYRHHGTLYCESEPGQGVWFSLDLPIGTMVDLEEATLQN